MTNHVTDIVTQHIRDTLLDNPDVTAEQILCTFLTDLFESVYSAKKHSDVVEILGVLGVVHHNVMRKMTNDVN